MPAGFQAINDSNIVQIDANYKNYMLLTKGLVQLSVNADEWLGVPLAITVTGAINPVIAVHCKEFIRIWRVSNGNGSYTFKIHGAYTNRPADPNRPLPANLWYYVFDSPPPAPSVHGVGMQVMTGTGAVAFDSTYGYMRVLGTLSGTASFPPASYVRKQTRFGNDKVAIVICQQALKLVNDFLDPGTGNPVESTNLFSLTARMESQSVIETLDGTEYIMYSGTANFINSPSYTYLAIDVSNLD